MWYCIDIWYGPGHQSHDVSYVWLEGEVTKEIKDDCFRSRADEVVLHEGAIGDVTKVTKLPENVRLSMIRKFKFRKKDAENMLKILKEQA